MQLKFLSINTFNSIPVTKFIIDHLGSIGKFHSVSVHHMKIKSGVDYVKEVKEHAILEFSTSKNIRNQSLQIKLQKYLSIFKETIRSRKENEMVILYCIDFQVIPFCLIPKILGRKVFVVYHQFEVIEYSNLEILSKFFYLIFKFSNKLIDMVIVPEFNRGNLLRKHFGVPREKIKLIPNTCNTKSINTDFVRSYNLKDIPSDHLIVAHIGNLGPDHFILNFLEALKSFQNQKVTFLFVGNSSEEVKEMLYNSNNRNIHIVDEVPHKELNNIYPFIDLGIILYKGIDNNFNFCAPNKLYEYWSYGVPVLAHQLDGLKGVFVNPLQGKLINMDDPEAFENTLKSINKKVYQKDKEELIHFFNQNFDVSLYLDKIGNCLPPLKF